MAARRVAETMSRRNPHPRRRSGADRQPDHGRTGDRRLPLRLAGVDDPRRGRRAVGIGAAAGTARWRTIGAILLAWVTTLPVAAALGALALLLSRALGW